MGSVPRTEDATNIVTAVQRPTSDAATVLDVHNPCQYSKLIANTHSAEAIPRGIIAAGCVAAAFADNPVLPEHIA